MGNKGTIAVGENIKKLRIRKGMSQKEFGKLVGKSESAVAAYEKAESMMPLNVLFEIADAAGVKPEELITGEKPKQPSKKWDAELRIFNVADRLKVIEILANNGYDVGQHKQQRTPTGKTLDYYVHATLLEDNANTAK